MLLQGNLKVAAEARRLEIDQHCVLDWSVLAVDSQSWRWNEEHADVLYLLTPAMLNFQACSFCPRWRSGQRRSAG